MKKKKLKLNKDFDLDINNLTAEVSINVNPNLKQFDEIVPCGVQNGFVTSIKEEGKNISLDQFDKKLKENFSLFF